MDFKQDALDDKMEIIDKHLSMCCFSSPPFPSRAGAYNKFLQQILLASLEDEIEQKDMEAKKIHDSEDEN